MKMQGAGDTQQKRRQQTCVLGDKKSYITHTSYLLQQKKQYLNQNNHYQTIQMHGKKTTYDNLRQVNQRGSKQVENLTQEEWQKMEVGENLGKRKMTQRIATKQLLEIDIKQIYNNGLNKSVSRSKSRNHKKEKSRHSQKSVGRKTFYQQIQQGQQNKVNIIHGVYNRNQHNKSHSTVRDNVIQKQNKPTTRHMSNFELLKLEAEELEKSNIVLGTKQHKSSTKELSLKQHLPAQQKGVHVPTRSQRYRYKHSLTNRNQLKNRGKGSLVSKHMESTLSDMKSYYHHIQKQIHSRSTHKLSTECDGQAAAERTYQLIQKSIQQIYSGDQNSLKEHHKSSSELHIEKKNRQVQTENSSSYLKTQTHLSYPLKSGLQTNPFGQPPLNQEYVIRNEFIPLANRSILDKNRHNIKKIGKNMNRLACNGTRSVHNNFNNTTRRCNTMGDEKSVVDKSNNQNIEEFVKNKMSMLNVCAKVEGKRNVVGMQCSYNKQVVECSQYGQHYQLGHASSVRKPSNKAVGSKEVRGKVAGQKSGGNAAKFYGPQKQRSKQKGSVMVIDPHLKAKAIKIGAKDTSSNKDIVIICL